MASALLTASCLCSATRILKETCSRNLKTPEMARSLPICWQVMLRSCTWCDVRRCMYVLYYKFIGTHYLHIFSVGYIYVYIFFGESLPESKAKKWKLGGDFCARNTVDTNLEVQEEHYWIVIRYTACDVSYFWINLTNYYVGNVLVVFSWSPLGPAVLCCAGR